MRLDASPTIVVAPEELGPKLTMRALEMLGDPRIEVQNMGRKLLACLRCDVGGRRRCDGCSMGFMAQAPGETAR
jgi:hypothetical protein